jgi:hypothetical protein
MRLDIKSKIPSEPPTSLKFSRSENLNLRDKSYTLYTLFSQIRNLSQKVRRHIPRKKADDMRDVFS